MKTRLSFALNPIFFYLSLCCILGMSFKGSAQAQDHFALPSDKKPPAQIKRLLHWADSLKSQHPTQALYYASVADSLALVHRKRFYGAQAAYWLAWVNFYEGNLSTYQLALTDAQICLSRLNESDPPFWRARAHALLAAISVNEGQLKQAKQEIKTVQQLAPKIKPKQDSLWICGMLHSIQGLMEVADTNVAKRYYLRAIANFRAAKDPISLALAHRNYALQLYMQGQFAASDEAFQKAIYLFRKHQAENGLRKALLSYGLLWAKTFHEGKDSSITFFNKALSLTRKALNLNPDMETYYQMGYIYHLNVLKYEKSPLRKSYLDSVQYYYYTALGHVTESNNFKNVQDLARNLDRLTLLRDYEYSTISDLIPAYDKLLSTERKATERAKWRLQINEKAQYQDKMISYGLWAFVAFLLAVLIASFLFYRNKLRHAQTQTLLWRTRLNPHFISNCLNSIDALIQFNKGKLASEYLVKFNRFCRDVLEGSDQFVVSIKKDLETLSWYLDLEKLRLGDRFNYHFDIDEQINTATTQIPMLLLQPYLENAIWHGIHPKDEGGILILSMQKQENQIIRITISDDGVGLVNPTTSSNQKNDLNRRSWGKRISEQMLLRFNRRASPVQMLSGPGGLGTQVIIHLNERHFPSKVAQKS